MAKVVSQDLGLKEIQAQKVLAGEKLLKAALRLGKLEKVYTKLFRAEKKALKKGVKKNA